MPEKAKTGISALDEILGGGVPRRKTIILAGACGTGKTILGEEFLFAGAREGEVGLYLTLSEPKDKILEDLQEFTFYDQRLVDMGKIKIVDIESDARLQGIGLQSVDGMMSLIRRVIQDSEAKRVVIDSVTALIANFADKDKIRAFIYELGHQLMYMNCTTFLISEIPPMTFAYSVYGVEEFIADGVILITDFERKGELLRAFQVVKMRGVNHSRNKYVMKILDDGINLIPLFKAGLE
jgi:circadian clock protein KaiC